MKTTYRWFSLVALTLFGVLAATISQAQDTIVTLAVPEYMNDTFTEELFAEFEAQNPGVHVVVEPMAQDMWITPPAYDQEAFRENAEAFSSQGDVLLMNPWLMSAELTRGGYLLDLAPLVQADTSLNPDDFYPAAWQAYQWNGGIWALPVSLQLQLLIYNPEAFDAAGRPYPDAGWTANDLLSAAETLTQRDDSGEITLPGFSGDYTLLIRSLLGRGFYDSSTTPESVLLTDPQMLEFGQTFADFVNSQQIDEPSMIQWEDIPLRLDGLWALQNFGGGPEMAAAPLPGGVVGLNVDAFAVSAGTAYPDAAYRLAIWLTDQVDVVARIFGDRPARHTLVEARNESENFFNQHSDEVEAMIEELLPMALPPAELRYAGYFNEALYFFEEADSPVDPDVLVRLETNETEANALLAQLDSQRAELALSVPTPIPTPILSADEVTITFNLMASMSPLPNREDWEAAIEDFVAADPEVGQIVFNSGFGGATPIFEENDCAYINWNYIAGNISAPEDVIALDPLLAADPNFDPTAFVPGVLESQQFSGVTYGYPLVVQPTILRYNARSFEDAGVPLPSEGWTFEQFVEALRMLQTEPDRPVMNLYGIGSWLMLIAAAGGQVMEFDRPLAEQVFNSPESVDAIRQVLDLARDGLIGYQELGDFGGGGGGMMSQALYEERLGDFNYGFMAEGQAEMAYVSYPTGSQFTPLAFTVGAAYISAETPNPEACYRWISTIAQRPELFQGMPARLDQFENPSVVESRGANAVEFYGRYAETMQAPNAVIVREFLNDPDTVFGGWISMLWLGGAFDAYVLEDADLETAMTDAQTRVDGFLECAADIERVQDWMALSPEESEAYADQFVDCALAIDPELARYLRPEE